MLSLAGCGLYDWEFNDLPNGYTVWRGNHISISVGKGEGNDYTVMIEDHVLAFCYNERYVGVQRFPVEMPYKGEIPFEELDKSNPEYYLIDTEEDTVYGPLTVKEYNEQLISCDVTNLCEWILTATKPEGAR